MTREQFSRLCSAFWLHAKPEQIERTFGVYDRGLGDLPANLVDDAINKSIRESDRMPTVAKLRSMVHEVLNASRRFVERPAIEGCPECRGKPEATVKDDGQEWRLYLRHGPGCTMASVLAKPPEHWWRDDWKREGRPTYSRMNDEEKTRLAEIVHGYLKRFDAKQLQLPASGA